MRIDTNPVQARRERLSSILKMKFISISSGYRNAERITAPKQVSQLRVIAITLADKAFTKKNP